MKIVIVRVVLYSTFNLEDFAIVWLHARSCVAILCCTPAYGLYSCASNTSATEQCVLSLVYNVSSTSGPIMTSSATTHAMPW
jgi:hypothetical protein